MAYCRFSEGDVYLYATKRDGTGFECCWCHLAMVADADGDEWWDSITLSSRTEALAHLREHQKAGHAVPVSAIARLEAEIEGEATPQGGSGAR